MDMVWHHWSDGYGTLTAMTADRHPHVADWLTIPDVAEVCGISVTQVRSLIEDRELIATRRGERNVLSVPAAFVDHGQPLPALRGTFTVLADGGFTDEEIIDWMFAPDPTLTGESAIAALRAGSKSEVRRRAMEDAL